MIKIESKTNKKLTKSKHLSCTSADEGENNIDPTHKAIREKERRQANNVRERYVITLTMTIKFFHSHSPEKKKMKTKQKKTKVNKWKKNKNDRVKMMSTHFTFTHSFLSIRLCIYRSANLSRKYSHSILLYCAVVFNLSHFPHMIYSEYFLPFDQSICPSPISIVNGSHIRNTSWFSFNLRSHMFRVD